MKRFLIILFSLLSALAQTRGERILKGMILESVTRETVPGANVVVKSGSKIKGFGEADAEGKFTLNIPEGLSDLSVTVTAVGFKTYTAPLDTTSTELTILLENGTLALKEVVVKGEAIRTKGDTVVYSVGSFAQAQDRSIGDVLKRMPGIDVEESGRIKYQGADINRFYIEGGDLLGGKYGIATNGISHDDVGAVEVLENHQPLQVLQGFARTDQAAINLKLKNHAKATFTGHGMGGGGWTDSPKGGVWTADLFGMMIKGAYQMITVAKSNNIGVRVADELKDFSLSFKETTITPYISVTTPAPPQLRLKSTYLNRSWMVSSSHLWKVGDGNTIKAQIDYLNDRVTAESGTRTIYFLPEGERMVNEGSSSLSRQNALTAKVSAEINRKTFYLTDVLNADLSWNDVSLSMEGDLPNSQRLRNPEFKVANFLKLIKSAKGSRLITFTSNNEWASLPEKFLVTAPKSEYGERLSQHSFMTDEKVAFGLSVKKVFIEMETGISGFFRSLSSRMFSTADPIWGDGETSLATDYLRLFVSPSAKWEHRRFEARLNVPMSFYSYFFKGTEAHDRGEFFLSPTLTLRWQPTHGVSLSATGSVSRSPAPLHNIHSFPVMTNYRHIDTGTDNYLPSYGESVSLILQWRHESGLFLNLSGSHRWNRYGYESVQSVEEEFVYRSFREASSRSTTSMVRGDVSKSIEAMNGTVGVRGSYISMESRLISQGIPSSMTSSGVYVAPFVNGALGRAGSWSLRFSWNRNNFTSGGVRRKTDSYIWQGGLTLTPGKWLIWYSTLDYYRMNTSPGIYVNVPMLDTRLTFKIKKKTDISAAVTNILGKKSFGYSSYGIMAQTESYTLLRGREYLVTVSWRL